MRRRIITSEMQMRRLGLGYAKNILRDKKTNKGAMVVGLYGNLGSGKTVFAQGFALGLRIKKRVQSPTFVLMRQYSLSNLENSAFKKFYHLDLYRIDSHKDIEYLALKEFFDDFSSIILIEWADRIEKILPKSTRKIIFKHGKNKKERTIEIKSKKF